MSVVFMYKHRYYDKIIAAERFKANKDVRTRCVVCELRRRFVVWSKKMKTNHSWGVVTTHDQEQRTTKGNFSSPPIFRRRGLGGRRYETVLQEPSFLFLCLRKERFSFDDFF